MDRATLGALLRMRKSLAVLLALPLLLIGSGDFAEAAKKRSKPAPSASSIVSNPNYAAIVIDGNTGEVLHTANADSLRHPASLTKIMTLYLLFERLESGRIKLGTPLEVSPHAAAQAPSKLGLQPGETISVEDAIKALVTKSANDVAVIVAEAVAGSESAFARQMTQKARALKMTRTTYRNASGLPDPGQMTSARDQALLGLAIQDRFPGYYKYFSTSVFSFRGRSMANHNRLLGRVHGVDGIKTGYIRASGFNLVTSARRDNRHIVAVVLGGTSGAQRDAHMRNLIESRIVVASTKPTRSRTTEVAAIPAPPKRVRVAAANIDATQNSDDGPSARSVPIPRQPVGDVASQEIAQPATGSTEPMRPVPVQTMSVRPGPATAQAVAAAQAVTAASIPPVETASEDASVEQGDTSSGDAPSNSAANNNAPAGNVLPPMPAGARPGVLGTMRTGETKAPVQRLAAIEPPTASIPAKTSAKTSAKAPASAPIKRPSGWMIQLGAFPDVSEAQQTLARAKGQAAKLLGKAEAFTEPVSRDNTTLHRARFAGLKQQQAEAACRYLKQNHFDCITIRN